MHATYRRIEVKAGRAAEVAALIEAEYLPLIEGAAGYVSYMLVGLGDDEVASLGLFADAASAQEANEKATAWRAERLGPLVSSPLEARQARCWSAIRDSCRRVRSGRYGPSRGGTVGR